jgi:hypothetical protein
MIVTDLDLMEQIVKSNSSLSWDGWNVVELKKSPTAMFKQNGMYKNGSWHIKNVYSPSRDGWRIPNKYVR